MIPNTLGRFVKAAVAALFLLPFSAAAAAAQVEVGAGYAVNAPDLMAGGTVMGVFPVWGGMGLFLDVKFDIDRPDDAVDFNPDLTAAQAEALFDDELYLEDDGYFSVSAGLVRPVKRQLMVYLGAGYTKRDHFHYYRDFSRERGRGGFYWVEDTAESETGVNVLGGLIFRLAPNILVRFGGETNPAGFGVALMIAGPVGGN